MLETFDRVQARLRERVTGLTQAEYLWEPVADMWSVRENADGVWRVERIPPEQPDPIPAPVTTIAWRLWHIGSECLAEYTVDGLGDWPFPALPVRGADWFGQVDDALAAVDDSFAAFRAGVARLGEDGLWQPLGPAWGSFGAKPWVALVLHALDEVVHHGAEIALLRDLYPHQSK